MARQINTLRRTLTAQIVFRFVCRNKRWRHKRHFRDSHLPAVPTVKGIQRFRFRRCYGAVKWGFGLLWCCESLYPACFQGIPRCCTGVAGIFHKKSRKFIAKTLDISARKRPWIFTRTSQTRCGCKRRWKSTVKSAVQTLRCPNRRTSHPKLYWTKMSAFSKRTSQR